MNTLPQAKRLEQEAKDGSMSALKDLGTLALSEPSLFLRLLGITAHHMQRRPATKMPTLSDRKFEDLYTVSQCFAQLERVVHKPGTLTRYTSNRPTLTSLWPQMCAWLTQFCDHYILDAPTEISEGDYANGLHDIMFVVVRLLATMVYDAALCNVMYIHDGEKLVTCLSRLLVRSVADGLRTEEWCTHVVMRITGLYPSTTPSLLGAIQTMSRETVNACVRTLVLRLSEPKLDLSILKSTLTFIGMGALNSTHVLLDLLASRIVYWVCYFIERVSARRENPRLRFQKELACLCTCSCTQILVLGRIMGYTWVAQMFESGVLQAILRLKSLFKYSPALNSDTTIFSTLCDFLKSLVPYLAYRSVLRHAAHALRDIRRKGLEDGFSDALQGDGQCLVRAWETLRDAIDQRWEFRERCFGKGLAKDTCCYKPCSKSALGMKACVKCDMAFYCSDMCQREAWTNGHRETCERIQCMKRDGHTPPPSPRDLDFAAKFALSQLLLSVEDLRKASEKHVHDHLPPVMELDLTSIERKVTFGSAHKYMNYKGWEAVVKLACHDRDAGFLFHWELPFRGQERYKVLQLVYAGAAQKMVICQPNIEPSV
ncbi:hypothetical protein BDZ89DRAFT_1072645 [Hymenopellis radicata]|nr:hypothetical protein BDZ89DRAFT_1072645 [Hymenopellis radicata]